MSLARLTRCIPVPLILSVSCQLAYANNYYDPALLHSFDDAPDIISTEEIQSTMLKEGVSHLHVFINGDKSYRLMPILLKKDKNSALQPCLTKSDYVALGVDISALRYRFSGSKADECVFIQQAAPESTSRLNPNQMALDITFPQAFMLRKNEDDILPSEWDEGIPALLVEYQYSGSKTDASSSGNDAQENYLNLVSGINLGAWRLRSLSSWQKSSGDEQHFDNIGTYIERTVPALKSEFSAGDTYTPADTFDSIKIKGIQLVTDTGMIPESQNGFAPVIHGIAKSNATVTVKEQGNTLTQINVTPGPFTIDNLSPVSSGGTLDITIKESNGQETHLQQTYSAMQNLQREGALKYAFAVGHYHDKQSTGTPEKEDTERRYPDNSTPFEGNSESQQSNIAQYNLSYGLPWGLTLLNGLQMSDSHFFAENMGIGADLGILGAVSTDVTLSRAKKVNNDSTYSGKNIRISYSRHIDSTETDIQTSTRYASKEYATLEDAMTLDNNNKQKKYEYTLSVNQALIDSWSLYLSLNKNIYYDGSESDNYQAGLNFPVSKAQVSLSFSANKNEDSDSDFENDKQVALSVSIPLSVFSSHTQTITNMATSDLHGNTSFQTGLSGEALEYDQLAYSFQTGESFNHSQAENSQSSVNVAWTGNQGEADLGYAHETTQNKASWAVNGGLIVHSGGVTLGQYSTGAMALISTPGVSGAQIAGGTGLHTDYFGYAIKPDMSVYSRDDVAFDTNQSSAINNISSMSKSVIPTRDAIVLVPFETHPGENMMVTLLHHSEKIPFGAVARTAEDNQRVFYVGDEGQVYISGVKEKGTLSVTYDHGKTCLAKYDIADASRLGNFNIITLNCD